MNDSFREDSVDYKLYAVSQPINKVYEQDFVDKRRWQNYLDGYFIGNTVLHVPEWGIPEVVKEAYPDSTIKGSLDKELLGVSYLIDSVIAPSGMMSKAIIICQLYKTHRSNEELKGIIKIPKQLLNDLNIYYED